MQSGVRARRLKEVVSLIRPEARYIFFEMNEYMRLFEVNEPFRNAVSLIGIRAALFLPD